MIFLIYVSLMIKLTQPRRKASKKVNSPLSNGPLQKKKKKEKKLAVTIVSNFSCILQSSQKKSKIVVIHNFSG